MTVDVTMKNIIIDRAMVYCSWLSPSPPSTDGDSGDNGSEGYVISIAQLAKQVTFISEY